MMPDSLKKRALNFPVKKQLGQNFLINKDVLTKIVDHLYLKPDDNVLEIGPGLGFLTEILASRTKNLIAIELDQYCVDELSRQALPGLNLIREDFLRADLTEILNKPTKVVGNIPYNITSPIIIKLLGEIGEPTSWRENIQSITLTVQRELANRLVAKPGRKDYSQITLLMNYYGTTTMLFKIGPENFSPPPQVESAVIQFIPHDKIQVSCNNHKLLRQVIKLGFASRRKMLKNTLSLLGVSDENLGQIFKKLNFDPQVRAESLSLQQFGDLADAVEIARKS